MDKKKTLDLAAVLSMRGGDDEASYACQSHSHNYAFHTFLKPHLSQIMESSNCLGSTEYMCLADFGCSHGRNTLDWAEFIVSKLRSSGNCKIIHYFFCDLPSNDFNSLFRLMEQRGRLHKSDRSYYAAGVPGSFYGRLFPQQSLHFAISIFSLHWLSQVPPEVLQRKSPAWNGGNFWIHGQRPATAHAYAQQFLKDAHDFLKYRAKELARGALLYLVFCGRAVSHPAGTYMHASSNPWGYEFESTWEEMISEGLMDEDMRDTFNIPIYLPCISEFEDVVAAVREFHVQELMLMDGLTVSTLPVQEHKMLNGDSHVFNWGSFVRSLTEPLLATHIGVELADEFFKRHERKSRETRAGQCEFEWDCVCAVLVRK